MGSRDAGHPFASASPVLCFFSWSPYCAPCPAGDMLAVHTQAVYTQAVYTVAVYMLAV